MDKEYREEIKEIMLSRIEMAIAMYRAVDLKYNSLCHRFENMYQKAENEMRLLSPDQQRLQKQFFKGMFLSHSGEKLLAYLQGMNDCISTLQAFRIL